ncbi:hypothetical protein LTR47_005571 [Exophiala xenobiotica]|nr:hypothetical protein LTR92_007667 [Exophiala xenobiotica]KAK5205351.1 hypothetical protein LTR41_008805 [Exophiala xenobiotica]KAK5233478.1 hypothetical protein LTR47_005571 [Exophiala xenobiotica]KAK5249417.1 hypothetical protein LTS06_005643 [Exophiala xenobiotica]KAK5314067.1 hypothetical protein LTR93_010597 [Exophiala xenobiotica]
MSDQIDSWSMDGFNSAWDSRSPSLTPNPNAPSVEVEAGPGNPFEEFEHFDAEMLPSPIVTLEVGPTPVLLKAHKNVLTRCNYFVKCLEPGKFEEGVSNKIRLPDDRPEDMRRLVGFLYAGRLLHGRDSDSDLVYNDILWGPVGDWVMYLIQCFRVADKFCVDEMCEAVMEVVEDSIPAGAFRWRHLAKLNDAGLRGSTFWQAVLKMMARGFVRAERQVDLDKLMNDGLASNPEISLELLKEIAKLVKEEPSLSCCKMGCKDHASKPTSKTPYPVGMEL